MSDVSHLTTAIAVIPSNDVIVAAKPPKQGKKGLKKKSKKSSVVKSEADPVFEGHVAQIRISGDVDTTTSLQFSLKGKKHNGIRFEVSSSEPSRFSAMSNVLNTAWAKGLKIKVLSKAAEGSLKPIMGLELNFKR